MPKHLQNPRLAKKYRSYSVDEVADLYEVHENTVRNWIKNGLATCDSKIPTFIQGTELNKFHARRKIKNKHPCKLTEIYCLRCRCPKEPVAGMVEYKQVNEKTGNLIGLCPDCACLMFRRISSRKILIFSSIFGFTLSQEHLRIVES